MINLYLFVELLKAASPDAVMTDIRKLDLETCKLANVVALSDQKLVAQLDCDSLENAYKAMMTKVAPVEGVVQTNVIAVVRPKKD